VGLIGGETVPWVVRPLREAVSWRSTPVVVAVLPHRSDSFPGFDPNLLQAPISGHLRPLRDRT